MRIGPGLLGWGCLAALSAVLADPPAPSPSPEERALREAEAFQDQIIQVVSEVRPSSVTVFNLVKQGASFLPRSGGSGVIITSGGQVLTNEHVIAEADRLEVALLDGRRVVATVEGHVPEYDIALLQLRDDKGRPLAGLKPAVFGSTASMREGDWVLATGNPFFLGSSGRAVVTLGVVSGLNRIVPGDFFYGNCLQHDAEINPGNSGGPLWDSQGRLVGINGKITTAPGASLGPSNCGVGFTIPVEQIRNYMKKLMAAGVGGAQAGDLGVEVETLKDGGGKEAGAKVTTVRPGSPAAVAKSPLQAGDVIECVTIKFKPARIRNATDLTNLLSYWPEGTRLDSVEVRRGKDLRVLSGIVLGPAPKAPAAPPGKERK